MKESKGGRSKESLILILKQVSQILKMWDFQLECAFNDDIAQAFESLYCHNCHRSSNEPKWNSSTWYEHC